MPDFPLHRFEEFGRLSAAELEALQALGERPLHYDRHRVIRREGVVPVSFYLLVEGWVAASRFLSDGGRQIMKVHLPGDAVGTPSMGMDRTVEELTCLTAATLIEVPLVRFWRLFEDHPRVGARFMLSVQLERSTLMDRLASIGRTSAAAQVATFLLDLADSLAPLGLAEKDSFRMVVTQEQIGDVLGMTGVHINRTLRRLVALRLIIRDGQWVTIVDRSALERLAERPRRKPNEGNAHLPPGREGLERDTDG